MREGQRRKDTVTVGPTSTFYVHGQTLVWIYTEEEATNEHPMDKKVTEEKVQTT